MSSNVKVKINRNMESDLLDAVKDQLKSEGIDIECPNCHKQIHVSGDSTECPYCHQKFHFDM